MQHRRAVQPTLARGHLITAVETSRAPFVLGSAGWQPALPRIAIRNRVR
jgi:hypothetical protein